MIIRLFEQSINCKSNLNPSRVTSRAMSEYIRGLLNDFREFRDSTEEQRDPVKFIQQHTLDYFSARQMERASTKASGGGALAAKGDISFFLNETPCTRTNPIENGSAKLEDANEIIVQAEMKKFKRILLYQETANNMLLNCDARRTYPLCKQQAPTAEALESETATVAE